MDIKPNWSDNVSVIAVATLAKGATARGTLDLREAVGAYLFGKIGRGGTTALSNGIDFLARRILNNESAAVGIRHPSGLYPYRSDYAAAIEKTCSTSNSNAGQNEVILDSVTSLAVGDLIVITDASYARTEWGRISKLTVASGTGITLDAPLVYTHTSAQADKVRTKAEVFPPLWLPGGSVYEAIFDYGDDSTGESAIVQALAQTYVKDVIA